MILQGLLVYPYNRSTDIQKGGPLIGQRDTLFFLGARKTFFSLLLIYGYVEFLSELHGFGLGLCIEGILDYFAATKFNHKPFLHTEFFFQTKNNKGFLLNPENELFSVELIDILFFLTLR